MKISYEFEKNNNIDTTINTAKPPIFWKDKEIVKIQLNKWKPNQLKKLIMDIANIELEVKKNYNNSILLITNFIFEQCYNEINN